MSRVLHFWPVVIVIALGSFLSWITDFVTLQGERTIYTVECRQGTWSGNRCTGKLAAAERYKFRALRDHSEVLFWIAGSAAPSGRMAPCVIKSGRHWSCEANADSPRSITLEMSKGHPVQNPVGNTRPFHEVSKITWLLLNNGIVLTDTAGKP